MIQILGCQAYRGALPLMTPAPDSLRVWLRQQITQTLTKRGMEALFLIWRGPQRVWRELLLAVAAGSAFEVWAEDTHELILRERFYTAPRVIWLPVARDEIGYFTVVTLEAAEVRQWTLSAALAQRGFGEIRVLFHDNATLSIRQAAGIACAKR